MPPKFNSSVRRKWKMKNASWQNFPAEVEADDETAATLLHITKKCRATGTIESENNNNQKLKRTPTISELYSLDQFHHATWGPVKQKLGSMSQICGPLSTATALNLMLTISEKGWWRSRLDDNMVSQLVDAACDEVKIVPLVETVLHGFASQRARYVRSAEAPARLKSSMVNVNKYMQDVTANFEVSDFLRRLFKKADDFSNSPNSSVYAYSEQDPNAQVEQPFGPSPHSFPSTNSLPPAPHNFILFRTNLFPILFQAEYEQHSRIEKEDREFGGKLSGQTTLTYKPGEASYFLDTLLSECSLKSSSASKYVQQQNQRGNEPTILDRLKTDASPTNKAQEQKEQQEEEKEKEPKPLQRGATAECAIDVDDESENDNKKNLDSQVSNDGDDVIIIEREKPQQQQQNENQNQNQQQTQKQQSDSSSSSSSSSSAAIQVGEPVPKFTTPSKFCALTVNEKSRLCTPLSAAEGPRIYIVDGCGHFVSMLCYADLDGCPHGIVFDTASPQSAFWHQQPTMRCAFDLYVANVYASQEMLKSSGK